MPRPRTGSIDKTSAGNSRVRVTIGPPGKGVRRTIDTVPARAEARRVLAAALEITREDEAADGISVETFGNRVLDERELSGEIADPDSDRGRWKKHIVGTDIALLPVRLVTPADVLAWGKATKNKIAGHQTFANTRNVLSVVFNAAIESGLRKDNPCTGLRFKRARRTDDPWTFATPDEQRRLLAAFSERDRHLVAFLIGSGLRAGEAISLRWADVVLDGDDPHVVVRYGGRPSRQHPLGGPTKTGRIRTVPLLPMALEALTAWRAVGKQKKNRHGLVFPAKRGGYRDEAHMIRWADWSATLKRANLGRRFRPHDFRHTCASSLVSGWWGRIWSLEEVRDMLGHTEIGTTQRYAHLHADALKRAARETRIGQELALGGKSPMRSLPAKTAASPAELESATCGLGIPWTSESDQPGYGPIPDTAAAFRTAVVDGDAALALRLAREIARPLHDLTSAVLAGGPLAITKALQLVDMLDAVETNERLAVSK